MGPRSPQGLQAPGFPAGGKSCLNFAMKVCGMSKGGRGSHSTRAGGPEALRHLAQPDHTSLPHPPALETRGLRKQSLCTETGRPGMPRQGSAEHSKGLPAERLPFPFKKLSRRGKAALLLSVIPDVYRCVFKPGQSPVTALHNACVAAECWPWWAYLRAPAQGSLYLPICQCPILGRVRFDFPEHTLESY